MSSSSASLVDHRPPKPRKVIRIGGASSSRLHWGELIGLGRPPRGGTRIEMGEVGLIEPTMALRLAAAAQRHAAAGEPFLIEPLPALRACSYLERVGLGALVGTEVRPGGPDVLFPITSITHIDELNPLGEKLEVALREHLPQRFHRLGPQLKRAYSELGDNACTHGKSDHGTFLLLQRYGRDEVLLAVGDLGIGIPRHISAAIPGLDSKDDGRRIAEALRRGVSGGGDERGDGLAGIVAAIRRAQFAESELRIWSGAGRVRVRKATHGTNDWLVGSHTQGTWAEFVLKSNG